MPRLPILAVAASAALAAPAPAGADLLGGLTTAVTQVAPPLPGLPPLPPVPALPPLPAPPAPPPLPAPVADLGPIVGTITGTLDTGTGGAVSGAVGTVGGLLGGTGETVDDTLETVVSGSAGGGALPADTVTVLLGLLGGARTTGSAVGGVTSDGRAPRVTVTPLSKLRTVGRTGRLRLRVAADEAGVVALAGTVRPGKARRGRRVSRTPIHFPAVVLAYRAAGSLEVTVTLSKRARRQLAAARDGRVSVQLLAIDVGRTQARSNVKRHLAR